MKHHLIILGGSLAYFIWLTAPDISWVNIGSDGTTYLAAAKYLTHAHPTGAPLYNLMNWLVLQIPIALSHNTSIGTDTQLTSSTEFWRLSLISAVSASITCVILYNIALSHNTSITKSYIAPLIYAASGIVVSQATILDTYALMTLLMVLQYKYRDNWKIVSIIGIIGIGIHHLIGLTLLPIIAWYWWNRKEWRKPLLVSSLGALWYLYIPLVGTSIWLPEVSLVGVVDYLTSQGRLIGGLCVSEFPQGNIICGDLILRVQDLAVFMLGGLLAAFAPFILGLRKDLISLLAILPIAHYFTAMPALQFTYLLPTVAFASVIVVKYIKEKPYFSSLIAVFAVPILFINIIGYDIGNTLDNTLIGKRFYNTLSHVEPNSVVWSENRSWEKTTIWLYNKDNNTDIETLINLNEEEACEAIRNRPLYRTVVKNNETLRVDIETVQPSEVWDQVRKQIYWPNNPIGDDRYNNVSCNVQVYNRSSRAN